MAGIVWPDMAAAFVAYMDAALAARADDNDLLAAGVRVSSKRTDATRQVVVRVDGGSSTPDVRANVRIGVRVLAESDAVCADLAALVAALIGAWPDGDPVCAVAALSVPYPVADASEIPECYLTAELVVRGVNL